MKINKTFIGYACALTAVMFWGIHSVVIRKLTLEHISPELIAMLRLFIGAFTVFVTTYIVKLFSKKTEVQKFKIKYDFYFWLTVIGLAFNFILFHRGLKFTYASNAILIETFSPVFVLFFIILMLPQRIAFLRKRHDLVSRLVFIILAGSVGSSLLLSSGINDQFIDVKYKFIGDILEFFAMLFFAMFFIGSNEYKKRNMIKSSLATTSHFLFYAGIIVALWVPFDSDFNQLFSINSSQWIWIFVLAFFSTGVAYTLWHTASKYLKVFSLTILFSLSAIFTVIIESLFFGTQITWSVVFAAILVLSASIMAELTYKEGEADMQKAREQAAVQE